MKHLRGWNDMGVIEKQQHFHFGVEYPFNIMWNEEALTYQYDEENHSDKAKIPIYNSIQYYKYVMFCIVCTILNTKERTTRTRRLERWTNQFCFRYRLHSFSLGGMWRDRRNERYRSGGWGKLTLASSETMNSSFLFLLIWPWLHYSFIAFTGRKTQKRFKRSESVKWSDSSHHYFMCSL